MAYLYRLIALVGLVFLLTPSAQASFPATVTNPETCTVAPCYDYQALGNTGGVLATFSTLDAACAYQATRYNPGSCQPMANPANGWNWVVTANGYTYYQAVKPVSKAPGVPVYSCPSGATLSGSSCTCNAGLTQSGNTCIAVNNCQELNTYNTPAGEYSGVGNVGSYRVCDTAGVASSGDSSLPGCVVSIDANFAVTIGGVKKWVGTGTFTGAKCSPDLNAPPASDGQPAPPPSPTNGAPTPCPAGKLPGTVNGTTVCADAGPTDPLTRSSTSGQTETRPDGTTVGQTTSQNTDCTPTTCTTTTTTTTTTTPPGGTATSETTTTTGTCSRSTPGCGQSKGKDYERSSFSGACGAAFACDGDAIMCSVALEQHKRNCALFVDATPESDLYNSEKGKTGSQYQNENVALGPGSFNQSNALGASAQCIQDRNITVMGNVISLPFSTICGTLQHFGTILMFISFLMAYRIVSRG